MNKTYDDLMNEAKQALIDNDELFVACIDELDSWNGYADGFRCFDMCELNELFCDTKVGDFLDMITSSFNHNDNYFFDSIYGLDSTDSKVELYRDNVWESELLDNIIENFDNIDIAWIDSDFSDLIESIIDYRVTLEDGASFFDTLSRYSLEQVSELDFKIDFERRPVGDSFEALQGLLRDFAVTWQENASHFDYAFSDLAAWSDFFETYGSKYNLLEEFRENGIA